MTGMAERDFYRNHSLSNFKSEKLVTAYWKRHIFYVESGGPLLH